MVRGSVPRPGESLEDGHTGPGIQRGRADNALVVAAVLAVLVILLLSFTTKVESWKSLVWSVVLLGLLFAASELFALPLKNGGRISIALLPVVTAMMISGPLAAALVVLFGIPVFFMERGDAGYRRVVYNASQYLIAAGLAAWVFYHTGGGILRSSVVALPAAESVKYVGLADGGKLVLPWILATVVFFALNTFFVSLVLAPADANIFGFWRRLISKSPGYLFFSGAGFLAALVYLRLEFTGVVLLFAPLVAARVVYTRYGTMRDVCDETTLAIMEAVEAGDMFSEGHSVGVADIAVAIAEEMNFQDEDIHMLKQAALLHDVGKLALDPSLTEKPGGLTPEEYDAIKQYPLISGRVVSREKSFAVVAPAVVHHHESVDGTGYVDGLAGDAIPLGARILAVADAFDAMQHESSYRQPLSAYDAATEVIRSKGIQFDPEVVDAFTRVATKRGIWTGSLSDEIEVSEKLEAGRREQQAGPEQPALVEMSSGGPVEGTEAAGREEGVTPAEGTVYAEIRGEIEKDIRDWESSDSARAKRRLRREKRAVSLRRKKEQETEKPED